MQTGKIVLVCRIYSRADPGFRNGEGLISNAVPHGRGAIARERVRERCIPSWIMQQLRFAIFVAICRLKYSTGILFKQYLGLADFAVSDRVFNWSNM